jgi:hypothetical protein
MLVRAVLDCALARGGKRIVGLKAMTHTGISFGLHRFPILQIAVGSVAQQSIVGLQFGALSVEQLLFERASGAEDKCILPVMGVVDGNMPVYRVTLASGLTREGAKVGQDEVRDSQIGFVICQFPNSVDVHAEIGYLKVDGGSDVSR